MAEVTNFADLIPADENVQMGDELYGPYVPDPLAGIKAAMAGQNPDVVAQLLESLDKNTNIPDAPTISADTDFLSPAAMDAEEAKMMEELPKTSPLYKRKGRLLKKRETELNALYEKAEKDRKPHGLRKVGEVIQPFAQIAAYLADQTSGSRKRRNRAREKLVQRIKFSHGLKQIRDEKLNQNLSRDLKRFLQTTSIQQEGLETKIGAVKAKQGEISTAKGMAADTLGVKKKREDLKADIAKKNYDMQMDAVEARSKKIKDGLDIGLKAVDLQDKHTKLQTEEVYNKMFAAEMAGIDISGLPESLQAGYYKYRGIEFEGTTAFNERTKTQAKKNVDADCKIKGFWGDAKMGTDYYSLSPKQQAEKDEKYQKMLRTEENRLGLEATGEGDLIEQELERRRSGEIPDNVSRETMPEGFLDDPDAVSYTHLTLPTTPYV